MFKNLTTAFLTVFSCALFGQEFSIYKQFYGNYDFTMIGNTLNKAPNNRTSSACEILTESAAHLTLDENEEVIAAYLYWSGNGSLTEADLDVKLNGIPVSSQKHSQEFFGEDDSYGARFGAFADVTEIVKNEGNGEYLLSDLDLNHVFWKYCEGNTNYGGWAIIIVYENSSLPNNSVTIYDGFKTVTQNTSIRLTLDGFMVTDVQDSKIGFLVWEGDNEITDEQLSVNNVALSNEYNPVNNPFNSTNSFTGATDLWNMDLDYFDLNEAVSVGDTSLNIRLVTANDILSVHVIAITLNTILPDAEIHINDLIHPCFSRTMLVDYTVSNINGEYMMDAGMPIAFYVENELVAIGETTQDLYPGETYSATKEIIAPKEYGVSFTVKVIIDDDGTGQGTILEINELNNTAETSVDLMEDCSVQKGLTPNGDGLNDYFNLDVFNVLELKIYNRYGSLVFEHLGEYTNQWHGQSNNGNELPDGTYYYVLKTAMGGNYAGSIYLSREHR